MNRELKFRVWQWNRARTTGKMRLHGFSISSQLGSGEVEAYVLNGKSELEIMQYTGLKDKNGTDVYEGDIIRLSSTEDEPYMGIMQWSNELVGFGFYDIKDKQVYRMFDLHTDDFVAVGNIYENKELLA